MEVTSFGFEDATFTIYLLCGALVAEVLSVSFSVSVAGRTEETAASAGTA